MGIDLSVIWFVIIVFATLMYIVMDGLISGLAFYSQRFRTLTTAMLWSTASPRYGTAMKPGWCWAEPDYSALSPGLCGDCRCADDPVDPDANRPDFRGVAFEFRFKATPAHRPFWDKAFLGGSILATFTQGVVVGAVLNGFSVTGRSYSGGPFDWLTPFTLFCGVGLVVAYALLGRHGW